MGTRRIDFNLDLGEGFGIWSRDCDEAALMTFASSANLACGYHAGDPARMRRAVALAMDNGVAIGAHPGLPDLLGFGRRPLQVSPADVADYVTYQVGALMGFTTAAGVRLHHVKLHGDLYVQCAVDAASARAYVEAVGALGGDLWIYTDRSSETWVAAERAGVDAVNEFYADLPMRRDGTRVAPGAGRHGRHEQATPDSVRARVRDFLMRGSVEAHDGGRVGVDARTICVHTDGRLAVAMAQAVRDGVGDAGALLSAELAP